MPPRGGKPKTQAQKRAEGNPGKRPIPPAPDLDGLSESPPDWLDAVGAGVWHRVVGELVRRGILADIDRDMMAHLCQLQSQALSLLDDVRDGGMIDSKTGWERAAFKAYRATVKDMRLLSSELGLTPTARARGVLPGGGEAEDEFERMFGVKRLQGA